MIVFFASVGTTLRNLYAEDGKLVLKNTGLSRSLAFTSVGLTESVIADYDAFGLYGLILPLLRMRRAVSKAVVQETIKTIADNRCEVLDLSKFDEPGAG